MMLAGILTTMPGPLLPVLSTQYHLADSQAGLWFPAQFLAALAGTLASTSLLRWGGHRFVLSGGYALALAGILLFGFVAWPGLLAAVALYGLGLGLVIPASNLLICELDPRAAAAPLNLLNAVWCGGAIAGPLLAGALVRADADRIRLAAGLAIPLLLVIVRLRKLPPLSDSIPPARAFRPDRATLLAGAMLFLYVGTENTVAGWLPTYAGRAAGVAGGWEAVSVAEFWAAVLAGRCLAPRLLRRFSVERLTGAALLLSAVSLLALLNAVGTFTVAIAAATAGLGLATVFPNTLARYARGASQEARSLMPLLFASGGLGGAVLPWLAGAASAGAGNIRATMAGALLGVLGMCGLWRALAPHEAKKVTAG